MTKDNIAAEISNKTGLEKKDVKAVLGALFSTITKSVINGEPVYIRGFGAFERKHRAEKTARNITKNSVIIVPAHDVPFFKPYDEFKAALK